MNETLQSIYNRRSIRSYKPTMPTREELQTVIDAAFEAPSAVNFQPWHITVCQNAALNDEIVEAVKQYHRDNGSFTERMEGSHNFYHAPCVVYLSAQAEKMRYAANDIGIMAQTLALAAHSVGLGTCIIWNALPAFKTAKRDYFIEKLGIPEGYEPYTCMSLGYPEGEQPPSRGRDKTKVNWI